MRRPSEQQDSHAISWAMVLVLGALSGIPPLAFDMYLPALPDVATDYGVPESYIQLTLSSCLIGIALGQLFGGPISDALGRRRPLLIGCVGYTALAFACAVAPSALVLVLLRFFMGLFGGVAVVISRAIVRDRSSGAAAARVFSLLMLVSSIAPIVAPVIGGVLINLTSWRGIFAVLGGLGAVTLIAVVVILPETLPLDRRRSGGIADTMSVVRVVVRDRRFMGYALTAGFTAGALFFYISSSSFVFQDIYGLSPQGFSAVFAGNAIGLMVFGQLNALLVGRLGPQPLLRFGVCQVLAGTLALATVVALGLGLAFVISTMVVANLGLPLIVPNATALGLTDYGREAGMASAFIGVLQFAIGAVATPLVGLFSDTNQYSMAYGMLSMAVLAAVTYALMVARPLRRSSDGKPAPRAVGHALREPA